MPATTISPFSARALGPHDDEVAVEDADVDHRLAAHPQHEQLAVAREVLREREHLFDVLGREHTGARGDVAEQRDVADRSPFDGRAGDRLERDTSIARGLVGSRREIALVLERREVRVHRGGRRQADRLADLPHAAADSRDRGSPGR